MSKSRYGETDQFTQKYWYVERLWELSKDLPTVDVAIEDINGPDEVTWFSLEGPLPTCREVAKHCRRINEVDQSYPILLTQDFRVFDGMHRIARAIMDGKTHIKAKRFEQNPEPDECFDLEEKVS